MDTEHVGKRIGGTLPRAGARLRVHLCAFLLLAVCCALDLLTGNGLNIPAGIILWKLRLPRMLTALVAGSALGLAGAQMQAIFRNPLADPHIMGVSGGAGLGAAIAALTVTSLSVASGLTLVAAAFIGALLTGLLVVAVSARVSSTGTLLLVGVMLGFILSAISSVLQYSAGEESLKLFYSWMAGSFPVPATRTCSSWPSRCW